MRIARLALMVALLLAAGCDAPGDAPGAADPPPVVASAGTPVPPVVEDPNGVEALGAVVIMERARAALRDAGSFRLTGDGVTEEAGLKLPLALDLRVAGDALRGTVVIGGQRMEWLVVGGQRYARADPAFWVTNFGEREGQIGRELVGDRWMLVPPGLDGRVITADLTAGELLDGFLTPAGKLGKGAVTESGGVPAITLTGSGDPSSAVLVSTVGEPYPIAWSGTGVTGRITEIGAPVPGLTAPAEDDVFDLTTLADAGRLTRL